MGTAHVPSCFPEERVGVRPPGDKENVTAEKCAEATCFYRDICFYKYCDLYVASVSIKCHLKAPA